MKKLLLASAVAALSVSAAQAAPTIYGKAFVTADYVNGETDYNTTGVDNYDANSLQVNSHGSRIGFKGSEPMTAETDVIYQLEYGVTVDGKAALQNRDTYLGVKNNNFGELRFGYNSAPLGTVNNVTVTQGFWDNLGNTKLEENEEVGALNMADSGRVSNSVMWKAPKLAGMPVEASFMYGADESFVTDNDDRDSGFGAGLMFDQGTGFTVGLGYDKDMQINGDIVRGTFTYDMSEMMAAPVKLGVLYQMADYDPAAQDETETGLVVSGEMGLNNFARPASVYAQYNTTENLNGVDNADSDQIVVGGKYNYKNNMTMHAYAGANNADIDDVDTTVFAVGGGLEYKF